MAKRIAATRRFFATFSATFNSTVKAATLGSALVLGSLSAPLAFAGPEDDPTGGEMTVDALVARPIGLATTILGAATFVVTLPFSALGGNIDQAADKLVVEPGRETFVRCLGCSNAGRPDRFKGKEAIIE